MREIPSFGGLNSGDVEDIGGADDPTSPFSAGVLDSEHGVLLKNWSAQDFSNIYVRFRAHLMNYARKFTKEEAQAEEIVQEAFLYLMTSLPELDSELGVLRYLRWKVKNLSIDAIRRQSAVNSRLQAKSGDLFLEEHGPERSPEPSEGIEAAEDAAIVRLALARLNANQRQALIYDVVEEHSNAYAAAQMKLEAGAFRQLLFRSRKSFKRELLQVLGERGLSLEDFLKGRKYLTAFSAVALMMGIFLLPQTIQPPAGLTANTQVSQLDSNLRQPLFLERGVDSRSNEMSSENKDYSQIVGPSEEIWESALVKEDPTENFSMVPAALAAEDTMDTMQAEARPLGASQDSSQVLVSAGRVASKILEAHYEADENSFVSIRSQGEVFQTDEGFLIALALAPDVNALLALAWSEEASSLQLASVLLEQRVQSTQLLGLATGIHSEISVHAGVVTGMTIATGFAASDLTQNDVSPLLVDGHLFNLGLEMRWSFDPSNTELISGEVRPLVRN